ncbi:hypothetical protein Prudu_013237, partial [Prunus dulcis]
VTRKRQIEGALDVTPLSKRPKRLNKDAAILIPGDEAEEEAEPVVPLINCIIGDAYMELPKLEQLLVKMVREQADLAFRLQAAANMEMCMKRALNATDLYRERDADQHAEENAAKIAELSSRLAEAEKALVSAEEARAAARGGHGSGWTDF